MISYVNKNISYILLAISISVIVLGGINYYLNFERQNRAHDRLLQIERQLNEVNLLYIAQLKAIKEKRGYQYLKADYQLLHYREARQEAQERIATVAASLDRPDDQNLFRRVEEVMNRRFTQFDRHINYVNTLPIAEARALIVAEEEEMRIGAEQIEILFEQLSQQLSRQSQETEQAQDRYAEQNNAGFVVLMGVALLLMLLTAYMGLKRRLIEKEKEIAERKAEIIRSSEELFSSAFEYASIGMALVAPGGEWLRVNKTLCQLLEYPEKELLSLRFQDITHPDDLAADLAYLDQMLRKEIDTYQIEKRYLTKSGRVAWGFLSVSLVLNEDGTPKYFISQIQDISVQKQAQAELENQKNRLSNVLEGTHAGTWEWNVQTGETIFNETWAEFIGYTLDELQPISIETWVRFAHPDDLAESNRRLQACFERRSDYYEYECRMRHKDGHWIWVLDKGKVLSWTDDGQPLWMFGTHTDITRTKVSELELVERKAFMEAVLETIDIGIIVCDTQGMLKYYNKATRELHGLPESTLPADRWWEYFSLLDRDGITAVTNEERPMKKALRGENAKDLELTIRHASGRLLNVIVSGTQIKGPNGELLGAVAAIDDITAIRRAQRALEASERRFKGIFNSTFQFIGFLEMDGTLLEANQTFLDFATLRPEDVVGKKFWEGYWWQISETTRDTLRASIARAAQGETISYEVAVWDQDKHPVTILFNLKPLTDASGAVLAIIAEGRPIQEIVDARAALVRKNQELEDFAYIAAHDLNEPLRKIGSFMQLLKTKYSDKLDDTGVRYVELAVDGARRMSALIDDLLNYARVGSENVPFETVPAEELLSEVVSLQNSVVAEKNARITWDPLPVVVGQKTPLRLLFQNLIGNGLKYQQAGTQPQVHISVRESASAWKFAVRDNGIGIGKEHHEKIFHLFRRLHTRREFAGTGMGLATCKKIVYQHGGDLWVESEPGQGSTFYFTIPKPRKQAALAAPKAKAKAHPGTLS
jgi:PAS domain S-box-containing protein